MLLRATDGNGESHKCDLDDTDAVLDFFSQVSGGFLRPETLEFGVEFDDSDDDGAREPEFFSVSEVDDILRGCT